MLGLLWVVTMLLALFSTITFSADYFKYVTLILFVIAVLLTIRKKNWIVYVWFLAVTSVCIPVWFLIWLL